MSRTLGLLCAAVLLSGSQAPSADDLAAKYVAATGGAAAWANWKTLVVRSRSSFFSYDLSVSRSGAQTMLRHDAWADDASQVDTRAFDGLAGWRVNPAEGSSQPRSLSAAEVDALRSDADWMMELVDHKARGYQLARAGVESIAGRPAQKLKVTHPNGEVFQVWLDDVSGLEVRRVRYATSPDGQTAEIVLDVGDYRKVGGLLLPHRVGPATREYAVNSAIDPAKFRRPGKSEGELARARVSSVNAQLLKVGSIAPDWTLKDGTGRVHRASDYKGRVIVMDFWAVWCAPCHVMMPGLQKLHNELAPRGVAVLGISTFEEGGDPVQLFRDRKYSYPVLLNGEAIAGAYAVNGVPTVYVIGVDGRIIHASAGADAKTEAERRTVIDTHLRQHKRV